MPNKKKPEIKSLYYITHKENLPSILVHGIVSHALVVERSLPYSAVYDASIVGNRKHKTSPDGNSLWYYANLYFQPRNPMLYRVVHEKGRREIVVIGVQRAVMDSPCVFLTSGNAASLETRFFPREEASEAISEIWDIIQSQWWNSVNGSKRKIMAECLIPECVPPGMLHTVYVADHTVAEEVRGLISSRLPVVPEPTMFFQPARQYGLTNRLSLAQGDMFFSHMQTLTVSVNTVGVMGKGLASRAKYQFPDVYVVYQDACRSKALRMGKPFLYKREASLDDELADEPGTVVTRDGIKWFLLFATKQHWRNKSDLPGIEQGLRWVVDNCRRERVTSLALPALGCGLGGLQWREVGPIMCRHLVQLDIPVTIYLPSESQTTDEWLSPEYLLPKGPG